MRCSYQNPDTKKNCQFAGSRVVPFYPDLRACQFHASIVGEKATEAGQRSLQKTLETLLQHANQSAQPLDLTGAFLPENVSLRDREVLGLVLDYAEIRCSDFISNTKVHGDLKCKKTQFLPTQTFRDCV